MPEQVQAQLMKVQAEYRKVSENLTNVGQDLHAYAGAQKEKTVEILARLQEVEQWMVGSGRLGNSSNNLGRVAPLVNEALQRLTDDNDAFQHLAAGNSGTARVRLKNSLRAILVNPPGSGEGYNPMPSQPERGGIIGQVTRRLRLLDVLPSRPVTSDSVEYIHLNSTGSAEEQLQDGAEKASVEFEGILKKAEIGTFAAHTTASKQVLSDHNALEAEIDRVLRFKVLDKFEKRLINGGVEMGSAPSRIVGLLEAGLPFFASIGTTPADKVGEALARMADRGYRPGFILMNPMDWLRITLTKRTDDTESYVFGSPTMPVPPALWDTPIVSSSSITEGRVLIVDTNFVTVLDREQTDVLISTSHKDYFTRNLALILGEMRGGLEIRDGEAVYIVDISPSSE